MGLKNELEWATMLYSTKLSDDVALSSFITVHCVTTNGIERNLRAGKLPSSEDQHLLTQNSQIRSHLQSLCICLTGGEGAS